MTEQHWTQYLILLAAQTQAIPCACVGCWYEQHAGLAFPGDQVSSTLCPQHRLALPTAVKAPDSLLQGRSA